MKTTKTIIDVRTPGEFSLGHNAGSINIPLSEIPGRLNDIKAFQAPIVLCCVSGIRSAQAADFLKRHGITCENAGSWKNLR